jgi:hypothetical protein
MIGIQKPLMPLPVKAFLAQRHGGGLRAPPLIAPFTMDRVKARIVAVAQIELGHRCRGRKFAKTAAFNMAGSWFSAFTNRSPVFASASALAL